MSEEKRNIEDEIRSAFQGDKTTAPSGIWDKIEGEARLNEEEKSILDAYKPKTDQWSKIQKSVVINEVWEDLSAELDRKKDRFVPFWFVDLGIATLLLIIMLVSPDVKYFHQHLNFHPNKDRSLTDLENTINNVSKLTEDSDMRESLETNTHSKSLKDNNSTVKSSNQSTSITIELNSTDQNLKKPDKAVIELSPKEFELNDKIQIGQLPILKLHQINLKKSSKELVAENKISNKKFGIGAQIEIGNSWIFNNTVRNGLNNESLSQAKISGGWGLGILAKYDFNHRFGVKAEYLFLSEFNQNYSKFENGLLYDYEIRLKMNKARISGTYSFLKQGKSFNDIHFGAFFSHIKNDQLNVSDASQQALTTNSYRDFDFGITVGLDMHRQLNDRYMLFYGVFSDIGLANIQSDEGSMTPAKFNYTNTFIFGIRGGVQINW